MSLKKSTYVESLVEGEDITEKFAVKDKDPVKEYSNGWFFKLMLGDRTGKISLVYWGGTDRSEVEALHESLEQGDVVEVKGIVSSYKGNPQITINEEDFHSINKVNEDGYRVEDYIPETEEDIDQMLEELRNLAESLEDENLSELVNSFLKDDDFVESLKETPYSKNYNNNYVGGLLEHVLRVSKLADDVSTMYPELNRDLLLSGAILHDMGKISEYETETSIRLTQEAQLVGHTVLCRRMIEEKMDNMEEFPDELALELSHLILSHHGDYEWGSPRSPRMEEAVALHHIDLLEVRMSGFLQAKDELEGEDQEMVYVSKEGVQRPILNRGGR